MRWNMFLGALIVSVGLCGQSYGFELLERMLGVGGYGCGCEPACCEPACGCEAQPACGCEAQPACGCEAAPACGCEPSCGCEKACCGKHCGGCGLLDGLFGHHGCCNKQCCEPACGCEAAPACGCQAAPACGCGGHHGCGCEAACGCGHKHCRKHCGGCGLLDGLFGHHGCCKKRCHQCCGCASACGCGAGAGGVAPAVDGGDAAPMPPAPMADPSASLRSRRRVVHATSIVRRQ